MKFKSIKLNISKRRDALKIIEKINDSNVATRYKQNKLNKIKSLLEDPSNEDNVKDGLNKLRKTLGVNKNGELSKAKKNQRVVLKGLRKNKDGDWVFRFRSNKRKGRKRNANVSGIVDLMKDYDNVLKQMHDYNVAQYLYSFFSADFYHDWTSRFAASIGCAGISDPIVIKWILVLDQLYKPEWLVDKSACLKAIKNLEKWKFKKAKTKLEIKLLKIIEKY